MTEEFNGGNHQFPFLDVSVRNPIMHRTWEDGQYTSYAITLETNHCAFTLEKSSVRRRYSEFVHLRKLLNNQHINLKAPALPPKALFENKFNSKFIEKRRSGLEKFIIKVLSVSLYLSNRTVHLFSQSNLPMHKIELIVEGRNSELTGCDPHLILNQTSSVNLNESTYSDSSDMDVTDFDASSHFLDQSSSSCLNFNCDYRSERTHSHVSQGARITLCAPTLHVPKLNCDQHSQSFSTSDSPDSDHYSVLATSSPIMNSLSFFSALSQKTESQHSSHETLVHNPINHPANRKKKVSFSTDITVSQVTNYSSS